jgi:hypothetical protein
MGEDEGFDPIDHDKLQQRYLVYYESGGGSRFATGVDPYEHIAREHAGWFIADGFPARVMKVTVEDGEPVARWV